VAGFKDVIFFFFQWDISWYVIKEEEIQKGAHVKEMLRFIFMQLFAKKLNISF
jgi:hypothetical protein